MALYAIYLFLFIQFTPLGAWRVLGGFSAIALVYQIGIGVLSIQIKRSNGNSIFVWLSFLNPFMAYFYAKQKGFLVRT